MTSFSLQLFCRPVYSVKTRVLNALQEFPATVRELESAGCGSGRSIRRVVKALVDSGGVERIGGARYALRRGAGAGYEVLR